jgi:hypothetical protein
MANDPRLITIRRDSFIEGEDGDRMYYALSDAFDKLNKLVQDTNIVNLPYPCIIYRMVNSESLGDHDPLGAGGSDWELADDTANEFYLGNGNEVTEDHGIFSFSSSGYWEITFYGGGLNSTDYDRIFSVRIFSTTNNSTYTSVAYDFSEINGADASPDSASCSISCAVLVKVTNISMDKIKFRQNSVSSTSYFYSAGNYNVTYVKFRKLADL